MLAASYWSLLAPAIESATNMGYGDWAFMPAAVGFAAGGAAMCATDAALEAFGVGDAGE
jgi:zinc transporter ZupT